MIKHIATTLVLLVGIFPLYVKAQENGPNLPAEGSAATSRKVGQYGVNRRVAMGIPSDPRVVGFTQIDADVEFAADVPPTTETNAGKLPNKPSFYFGARGKGKPWIKNNPKQSGPYPGHWAPTVQSFEVDGGLEYDARPTSQGWRAFISINSVQTNYAVSGKAWRGKAKKYHLRFVVDDGGFVALHVIGADANFSFYWSHDNKLGILDADSVFDTASRALTNLKKVTAVTRPTLGTNAPTSDNWRLDGTRFTCFSQNCIVHYEWKDTWVAGVYQSYLYPQVKSTDSTPVVIFGIDGANTNYDVPFNANDCPTDAARSRRIVDFPVLDGAISQLGYPNRIDKGRSTGEETLTSPLKQKGISHYVQETVRINLDDSSKAKGKIRIGNTP